MVIVSQEKALENVIGDGDECRRRLRAGLAGKARGAGGGPEGVRVDGYGEVVEEGIWMKRKGSDLEKIDRRGYEHLIGKN
jgi:hypothetical protein